MSTHDRETREILPAQTERINLTPSQEGYATVARLFVDQLFSDIPQWRRAADAGILCSLMDTLAYLRATSPAEYDGVMAKIESYKLTPTSRSSRSLRRR